MINENYCSFEISKLLKEKGFDEPCITWYNAAHELRFFTMPLTHKDLLQSEAEYLAPTHQMAMEWLRKVHDLHIQVLPWRASEKETKKRWCCWIYESFGMMGFEKYKNETPKSYEEGVEVALKYILENLI